MIAAASTRGLTLVELMVCVALLVVLLTLAVPGMQAFLARRELEGLSAQFVADLQFARSTAVARSEGLRLRVHSFTGGSCYLVHTGAANQCACTDETTTTCTGSAQVLRAALLPTRSRSSVQANVASLLIDPRQGTVSPTGSIEFSVADGSARRHVINILGRVRVCNPGTVRSDVPAC